MINNTNYSLDNLFNQISSYYNERECHSCGFATFASAVIISCLSPVAVVGNTLILGAIWKKTFQRTTFHILLSGLAVTDLCTGLITQPFLAAYFLLLLTNPGVVNAPSVLIKTTFTIGKVSFVYFGAVTLLFITLMSIERWLHMSRQSLMTSRRLRFMLIVLLLVPVPFVVLSALNAINGTSTREVNTAIAATLLVCYVTSSVAYFKVFRIIRQHQQKVQGNQSSQNFGKPAINLAKYKRSVVSILHILASFSFCYLPVTMVLVVHALVGDSLEVRVALRVALLGLFQTSSYCRAEPFK